MSSLGKRIRKIREERGLNQEAFSKELGISRASLAKLELGEQNNPGAQLITRIVELGYNANWLLTGKGSTYFNETDIGYDRELLIKAFSILEKCLSDSNRQIEAAKKGKIAVKFYEHLIKYNISPINDNIIEKEATELLDFLTIDG
jgi:transcriptional regulator with XRE-family HTH domain